MRKKNLDYKDKQQIIQFIHILKEQNKTNKEIANIVSDIFKEYEVSESKVSDIIRTHPEPTAIERIAFTSNSIVEKITNIFEKHAIITEELQRQIGTRFSGVKYNYYLRSVDVLIRARDMIQSLTSDEYIKAGQNIALEIIAEVAGYIMQADISNLEKDRLVGLFKKVIEGKGKKQITDESIQEKEKENE